MKKLDYLLNEIYLKRSGVADLTSIDRSVITNYLNRNVMPSKNAREVLKLFFSSNDGLFDDLDDSKFLDIHIIESDEQLKTKVRKTTISMIDLKQLKEDDNTYIIFSPVMIPIEFQPKLNFVLRVDVFKVYSKDLSRDMVSRYIGDRYNFKLLIEQYLKSFDISKVLENSKETNRKHNYAIDALNYEDQFYRSIDTFMNGANFK